MERIFIVGCSRSGTTIFQRLFSSYYNFYTAPETGFFLPGGLHLALRHQNICYPEYTSRTLSTICNSQHLSSVRSLKFSDYVDLFLLHFDEMAINHNLEGWVEKTPLHLLRISLIKKYIQNAHFIIVVREPLSVLNSMLKRSSNYPKFKYQNVRKSIQLINKSMRHTLLHASSSYCSLVSFEKFKKDPECIFDLLSHKLCIPRSRRKLSTHFNILRPGEDWKKEHTSDKINDNPLSFSHLALPEAVDAFNLIDYPLYNKIKHYF